MAPHFGRIAKTHGARARRGRPPTARGTSARQVVVRVSQDEAAQLDAAEAEAGTSAAEQFRRARFRVV